VMSVPCRTSIRGVSSQNLYFKDVSVRFFFLVRCGINVNGLFNISWTHLGGCLNCDEPRYEAVTKHSSIMYPNLRQQHMTKFPPESPSEAASAKEDTEPFGSPVPLESNDRLAVRA
jgi:hypothetical protein